VLIGSAVIRYIIIIIVSVSMAIAAIKSNKNKSQSAVENRTIRCPNCGSPATDYGSYWECGYCGDSGTFRRN